MGNNSEFKSIISNYITGMLQEKRSNGYSYDSEEKILKRFDRYCTDNCLDKLEVNKVFLEKWMERTETEGNFNQGKRISVVRQLLLYMASCGIIVYIPHDFCHFKKAQPHIFDSFEIHDFFNVVDAYRPEHRPAYEVRLANEYRLIFRLYCCCGLRNAEVAGIAKENVNLEEGILTLLNSKGNKDRLVYLSEDLRKNCIEYFLYIRSTLGFSPKWFFPAKDPDKPIKNTTMDKVFNNFWGKTKYALCNNKPTIHDFRFTFVVNRMNIWAEESVDLNVMMPYLSRYLGHKSINETFYYYYLVSDAYKTLAKNDTVAGAVIPEVVSYE